MSSTNKVGSLIKKGYLCNKDNKGPIIYLM
jgi:hypothetical protein